MPAAPNPEKDAQIERVIHLRAFGHTLGFIAQRVGVSSGTVHNWCSSPKNAEKIEQVRRARRDDMSADVERARSELLDQLNDPQATRKERAQASAVLLANYTRTLTAAAAGKVADAADRSVLTREQMQRLEDEAREFIRDVDTAASRKQ